MRVQESMNFTKQKIGSLDALCSGGIEKPKLIVLCHGFGAPGDDLAPLINALPKDKDLSYIFPEAPLKLPPIFGGGRAWWNIDFASRQEQIQRDGGLDMSRDSPEGLDLARDAFDSLMSECSSAGGEAKKIVVGGFSQGAMVTLDWALRTEKTVAGVIQWSTTFLNESVWRPAIASLKAPVLQSHGTSDPILPYSMADKLAKELHSANEQSKFITFPGQHGIPDVALKGARESIRQWLDV